MGEHPINLNVHLRVSYYRNYGYRKEGESHKLSKIIII